MVMVRRTCTMKYFITNSSRARDFSSSRRTFVCPSKMTLNNTVATDVIVSTIGPKSVRANDAIAIYSPSEALPRHEACPRGGEIFARLRRDVGRRRGRASCANPCRWGCRHARIESNPQNRRARASCLTCVIEGESAKRFPSRMRPKRDSPSPTKCARATDFALCFAASSPNRRSFDEPPSLIRRRQLRRSGRGSASASVVPDTMSGTEDHMIPNV